MPIAGLGCDCYQIDSGGNCLDPQPCSGDTTLAFDPVTGLAITPNSPSTTPIVTATGWNNGGVVSTVNESSITTPAVTSTCTESIITGVCDYLVYGGLALAALWLMSGRK